MSAAAPPRMARYSLAKTFEAFWGAHVAALEPSDDQSIATPAALPV